MVDVANKADGAKTGETKMGEPRIVVFSTLFPHPGRPGAGLFIRERMFRVAKRLPLVVISPQPWFPLQSLLRLWRPHFRPPSPRTEVQEGIEVFYPRFFCVPGLFKSLDGWFMALGSLGTLRRLRRRFAFDLIDAHFAYPDGYAAVRLGRWLQVPVSITLRGTEVPQSRRPVLRRRIRTALEGASRIFAVAGSLQRLALDSGIPRAKTRVIGNGVDLERFHPVPREEARRGLALPDDALVLVSVGALTERKGIHRVIQVLPALREQFPGLQYLVVGGGSPEGDWRVRLEKQVRESALEGAVRFLGRLPPEQLKQPLSAADVFVLATRNEGWANVFLEAMACGLPVVTTDVGGNAEVVNDPALGLVIPFGSTDALHDALARALVRVQQGGWARDTIIAYARDNAWDGRVDLLVEEFRRMTQRTN